MTVAPGRHPAVEAFLDRAIRGDRGGAVGLAVELLDQGASPEAVIVEVLAAAQRETGRRWLRDEWSVADEHVVTGVTQRALDAVANTAELPTSGSVVIACAEGDWHSLPSQMFGEIIRSKGYDVSFLGASTPADHVGRLLARHRPDALIVTCNLALFFAGVTRLADTAHRVGVPVIAGGRALINRPRALRLGADSWEPDIPSTLATLCAWVDRPPPPSDPVAVHPVASVLDIESPALAARAFDTMVASHPYMRVLNAAQLDRTRDDLVSIVRYLGAARLVEDTTVFTEFLDWLGDLLEARKVPLAALVAGLDALAPVVEQVDRDAGDLIRFGLRHLAETPDR